MTNNEWKYKPIALFTASNTEYFIQIAKYDKTKRHSVCLRVLGLLETRDILKLKDGGGPFNNK